MTFKTMALVTAVAAGLLGLRFIFAGASVLAEWGLAGSDASLVMCRRLGALYLGLAVMVFLGRSAGPSELRSAVCLGLGAAIALLACLGLFELQRGRVSAGIITSVVAEAVLAAGFAWAWRGGR